MDTSFVNNQTDFTAFLQQLRKELKVPSTTWENDTLESFLMGLEGYCTDKKQVELSWNTLAELLLAATVYE